MWYCPTGALIAICEFYIAPVGADVLRWGPGEKVDCVLEWRSRLTRSRE
jgi:hypothetical protein